MFCLKILKQHPPFIRNLSNLNMKGKILASPESMTDRDIKSILWTAIELKQILDGKCTKLEDIKGARVTFLMKDHSIFRELPAIKASEILDVKLNIIVDKTWDTVDFIHDTLKFVEMNSDLIMIQSKFQCLIDQEHSLRGPVFTVESRRYKVLQILSDLLTMRLKYGKLNGLKLAWLGPPTRVLNTYLCLGPKLDMNISYRCSGNKNQMQSPAALELAKTLCSKSKSTLQESTDLRYVVKDAKVIALSDKDDETISLNFDVLRLAGPDCSAIFELPRAHKNVEPGLVEDEKCLVWRSIHNMKWIYAAIMLRLLSDYKHITEKPTF